jgi:hypothetical protein
MCLCEMIHYRVYATDTFIRNILTLVVMEMPRPVFLKYLRFADSSPIVDIVREPD